METVELIRVTTGVDLANIALTQQDMMVMVDRLAPIPNGTMPMPSTPRDKQSFWVSSNVEITNLTLNSAGKTVNGDVSHLPANTIIGWFYSLEADAWFPDTNPLLTIAQLGLENVDNTSDLNKPISTATQTALDNKLDTNGNGGSLTGLTASQVGLGNVDNTSDASKPISTATQTALDTKLATNGNGGSLTGLTKTQVGLANVDNTTDAGKPVSTAQQTALNLKAPLANPTFTGTVGGVTAAMVGLGNVNNTADSAKPISTAQQTALDTKQSTLVSGTNIKTINGASILGSGDLIVSGGLGYTLNVQALTSSPADGATIFFGQLPKAPVTVAATSKIFIRKAGTIKMAQIYCFSGTAGTNEAWPMSIRLNNTTDTLIASLSVATSERVFSNIALNITVVAGDFFEIKCVNPTWVTNPLTTIFSGYIYIE